MDKQSNADRILIGFALAMLAFIVIFNAMSSPRFSAQVIFTNTNALPAESVTGFSKPEDVSQSAFQGEIISQGNQSSQPQGNSDESGESASNDDVSSPDGAEPAYSQKPPMQGVVNINTATKNELMSLPGIGEVKAMAIINYRQTYGDFQSVGELINVSGIGEKTLEGLLPYVEV